MKKQFKQKLKGGKLMEDLINDSIIESISEEYQIYKMIIEDLRVISILKSICN